MVERVVYHCVLSDHGYFFYYVAERVVYHYYAEFLISLVALLSPRALFVPAVSHLIFVSDGAFRLIFDAMKTQILEKQNKILKNTSSRELKLLLLPCLRLVFACDDLVGSI